MVPRGPPEPRIAALALPLPAGGVSLRATRRPRARPPGPGARVARHGCVRRRSLLVGRRHLREGVTNRGSDAHRAREPRPRRGDTARPADTLVPQHLVVRRRQLTTAHRGRRSCAHGCRPPPCGLQTRRRTRPRRLVARTAPLRERVERATGVRRRREHSVSEGRDQRPRGVGRGDGQSGRRWHQGGALVPRHGRCGWQGRTAVAVAPDGRRLRLGGRCLRRRRRGARAGRGRVLCRDRAGRDAAGAAADSPAGVCRACVEQTDLPVQRGPLARRRPRVPDSSRRPQTRSEQRLATPRLIRRPGDAGSMGVPVVRCLGPRVSRDSLGTPRSCLREVSARRTAPRVVPASERRVAGLRVELRRRRTRPCT